MGRIYTKKQINLDGAYLDDLSHDGYDRTVRKAIELSATSNSYQEMRGKIYQWDNIAPEIALVILQNAKENGVDIQQEVFNDLGANEYNNATLQNALDTLNNNPDYTLFLQKLALKITNKKSRELTLNNLKLSGITTNKEFDKIFTKTLLQEKNLSKNYPNFTKIKNTDDFNQFITYLSYNPLFDKFLNSFTDYIAYEYNKNRPINEQIKPPSDLTKNSLDEFIKAVSYTSVLKSPPKSLQKNTLYVEFKYNKLYYTVVTPDGQTITDAINLNDLHFEFNDNTTEEQLKSHLPSLLAITSKRGHTGNIALNSTESLRNTGQHFIAGDVNHDLFLSYLPALDMVKDEEYKFILYQWLEKEGNLTRLKDQLTNNSCQHAFSDLDNYTNQAKSPPEIHEYLKNEIETVSNLMKEIIPIISSLEDDPNEQDIELDKIIEELAIHLGLAKEYYKNTPIQLPGENFPTTTGHFENFVKEILFNTNSEKVIQYISNKNDSSKIWKVDAVEMVNALINKRSSIEVRNLNDKNDRTILTDENGLEVSPTVALRNQLKSTITTQLKKNIHHDHTYQSYKNDQLTTQQAPLSFKGINFPGYLPKTSSLPEIKAFAQKTTLYEGERSTDSHLLGGQENNIRKHEIRSGSAATQFAATGIDGTRSVTDKFDIALQFGGEKDVKIMYILRGKEGFHSQAFLDPFGKNKLSEIAYTHISPNDYVMTILYDKNNVILDVIPGNLSGEIQGVSNFSHKVLSSCIDFYNQKHNSTLNYKPTIKLPDPSEQSHIPANQLYQPTRPLIDILRSHNTQKIHINPKQPEPETKLSTVRITHISHGIDKRLTINNLHPETILVPFTLSNALVFSNTPFPRHNIQLKEEQEKALAHYQMKQVLTLKNFTRWTPKEKGLQEQYNRILQPGFMEGDSQEQLKNADIAQEEWLTDVLVPTIQTSFLLHVAARLITDYEIDIEDINEYAQKICSDDVFISSHAFSEFNNEWTNISKVFTPLDKTGVYESCVKQAQTKMQRLYPNLIAGEPEYHNKFEACLEIEKNKVRKQMTNEAMSKFLDKHMDDLAKKINLTKKTIYKLADNHDLVFLGPPGSGKSTISRQYLTKEDKKKYVSLATDDYRGIYKPNTQYFENKETEQVFIRTQDSAYLISELVEKQMKNKTTERPNVIVDAVFYTPSYRRLVEKNTNSTLVYACLDTVSEVVYRCYQRAIDENAGSADKGRFVNTASLLEMHRTASLNLVAHCPINTTIKLYNTNIPKNEIPPLIATVDTHGEKTITISHEEGSLMTLASFFNKSRLNVEARNDESLFMTKMVKPEFQVESLFAVMDKEFKIVLTDKNDQPILTVKKENNVIVMDILNPVQIKNTFEINDHSPDKSLLRILLLYGQHGSLKAAKQECLLHDDIDDVISQYLDQKNEEMKSTLNQAI